MPTNRLVPGFLRFGSHPLGIVWIKSHAQGELAYSRDTFPNIRDMGKNCFRSPPRTHLIGPSVEKTRQTILAPLELRAKVQLEKTNLVSRML